MQRLSQNHRLLNEVEDKEYLLIEKQGEIEWTSLLYLLYLLHLLKQPSIGESRALTVSTAQNGNADNAGMVFIRSRNHGLPFSIVRFSHKSFKPIAIDKLL